MSSESTEEAAQMLLKEKQGRMPSSLHSPLMLAIAY